MSALVDVESATLQTAMRHMVASARLAYAQVSRAIGRNDRYVPNMLNNAVTPRADLLCRIANACGYDVLLVGHGEALELTPERMGGTPITVRRRYRVAAGPSGVLTLDPRDVPGGWGVGWEDDFPATDEPPADWEQIAASIPPAGAPAD